MPALARNWKDSNVAQDAMLLDKLPSATSDPKQSIGCVVGYGREQDRSLNHCLKIHEAGQHDKADLIVLRLSITLLSSFA